MNRASGAVEALIDLNLTTLPGWCTPEKGKRMAALATGASLCVELGVFGGRSLVAMALSLRGQGFGRVHGIDPYTAAAALEGDNDPANDEWWGGLDYEDIARAAQGAIGRLGLVNFAQLILLPSREAVSSYADGTIDVLHQDSNHSEEISCEEVSLWTSKIRPGGYWIFDDTDWPSTQKAQRALVAAGFEQLEDHGSWKVYRRA